MDTFLAMLFSSEQEEKYYLDCLGYFFIFMAACTFFTLLFENVPYGRYASSKYGYPINVKFAWFVQELPAFMVPLYLVLWTPSAKTSQLPNGLLIAMYFCHYVQRAFHGANYDKEVEVAMSSQSRPARSLVYPFLIRGGKPTPVVSFALAFVFCILNGYMQIRYLTHYAEYPVGWVTHPCFIIGSALWLVGWLVNVHSDHILRNLRKPGETGYKIPRGGLFEYVSGANFLGEITEWAGFALAGHSVHSTSFSIFTLVVLANRAVAHHRWYLNKFEDYPKSRKALLPFVF